MIINLDAPALRVAFVAREHLGHLPQDWARPGVYVLLASVGASEKTQVYVGKAIRVRDRFLTHRRKPPVPWWRAVAITQDTTNGFNSAEIGYLEGRIS